MSDRVRNPEAPIAAAARIPVSEVISARAITVPADYGIEQVVDLFLERGLSRMPVVDDDGRPIGMISKTDLVIDQAIRGDTIATEETRDAEGRHVHEVGGRVRDVMTPIAESLPLTASLADAARRMVETLLHAMPVIDDDGRVAGVVSVTDVAAWVAGVRMPDADEADEADEAAPPPRRGGSVIAAAGAAAPAGVMTVGALMSQPAITCRRDDTLQAVVERMRDHDIGAVAIVDGDQLVGVVTDRDVALTACDLREPLDAIRADAAMSGTVLICHPDDAVLTAEEIMEAAGVRRIMVVDADGRALGTLSADDLAVEALRELDAGLDHPQVTPVEVTRVVGAVAQRSFRGMRPIPPGSEAMPRPV